MITVQPDLRPTASQILQSREVSKAIKYFSLDVASIMPDYAEHQPSRLNLGLAVITNTD